MITGTASGRAVGRPLPGVGDAASQRDRQNARKDKEVTTGQQARWQAGGQQPVQRLGDGKVS